jgi:proteic killer suppression protein
MILRIRHRGLRRLYEDDDHGGLNADQVAKISTILAWLDVATRPRDMDLPGLRLHSLKGARAGFWSVTVRANWRIIFCFEGENATEIDYLDYH